METREERTASISRRTLSRSASAETTVPGVPVSRLPSALMDQHRRTRRWESVPLDTFSTFKQEVIFSAGSCPPHICLSLDQLCDELALKRCCAIKCITE